MTHMLTETGIQIDTRFLSLMKFDAISCDKCSIDAWFAKCICGWTCTCHIVQNIERSWKRIALKSITQTGELFNIETQTLNDTSE